jgi:hypothetical protein
MMGQIIFKHAQEEDEFLQIHRINYRTFVEEIPQHQENEKGVLVDKYHIKNNYIIARDNSNVLGMVSYNLERPFSLDEKINDLDQYLPEFSKLAEIRLLSVIPEARNTTLAYRMFRYLCSVLMDMHVDAAVISGTTRQLPLYHKIGFKPFANLVGKQGALYQPMFININALRNDFKAS